MDTCLEAYNTTDCLLQSVLDALTDHNKWDVPTFVTTLLIGVATIVTGAFALMFAVAAVLQATIGPGSQKSSKHAIGKWSTKTKRHINWSELRLESITYTPVITSTAIRDILKIDPVELDTSKAPPNHVSQASWLHLLVYIGMDDVVWERWKSNVKYCRRTGADYLPSVIKAVPAYMDIDAITVLAAAAGCVSMTIDPETNCPLLTGPNVQVHFRRDASLGVVASFEHYESEGNGGAAFVMDGTMSNDAPEYSRRSIFAQTSRLKPNFDMADRASQGLKMAIRALDRSSSRDMFWLQSNFMEIAGELPIKYNKTMKDFVSLNNRASGRSQIRPNGNPLSPIRTPPWMTSFFVQPENSTGCLHTGESRLCRCFTLFHELVKQYDSYWILCAEPIEHRELFPANRADIARILGTVVVQGTYWSTNHLSDEQVLERLGIESGSWRDFWNSLSKPERPTPWQIFALCLQFAVDLGKAKKEFLLLPRPRREHIRSEIIEHIKDVDDKIERDAKAPQCTRAQVFITSAALMRLEQNQEHIPANLHKRALIYRSDTATGTETGHTTRNLLRMLRDAEAEGGESLIVLYNLFVEVLFSDCLAVEVDALVRSLVASPPKGPSAKAAEEVMDDREQFDDGQAPAEFQGLGISGNPSGAHDSNDDPTSLFEKEHDSIRELLIYRSILFGIVCLTALDNSAVLDLEIGNRIVPFL